MNKINKQLKDHLKEVKGLRANEEDGYEQNYYDGIIETIEWVMDLLESK